MTRPLERGGQGTGTIGHRRHHAVVVELAKNKDQSGVGENGIESGS